MAVHLLQSASRYLEHSPDLIYCTHDGDTKLHPPCYGNDDAAIVDRCVGYFTGRQDSQPLWSKRQQQAARERWTHCHHAALQDEGLDLQFFFRLFDDFFFCAPGYALGHRVQVLWSDRSTCSSSCQARLLAPSTDNAPCPHALIKIPKPSPTRPFTAATVQTILSTLLHSMAHAFLLIHTCTCHSCRCAVTRASTVGVTGHGPLWVRLCEAMEEEAERTFEGLLSGGWDLDCHAEGASVKREQRARNTFEKKPLVREELERRAGRGE